MRDVTTAKAMTPAEIIAMIREEEPELLLADGFEDAIVGLADGIRLHSTGAAPVVVYDYEKCIQILMQTSSMSEEEAEEYFEFNTIGAWAGPETPIFLHDYRDPSSGSISHATE